ncbi:putative sporulation protein YtxC [Evansella vedderi]|uniref:Sporulation protein YtxC n=1 Tax=Evansella vedderi TaxID=38282 RepID=A0ABT9ZUZ7_9BACI|nr:putative sporulation protein YtxC [Evansella vedderi]MDQ0255066.1 putative sporulation protein YtxC [Evansella vedderi]
MLTIQFKDSSLCEAFYHQLLHSLDTYGGGENGIVIEKIENYTNLCINFSVIHGKEKLNRRKMVATILTNVTIKEFLPIWLNEWICDRFHFEDPYEIEAITEHAREIFFNTKHDVPLKTTFVSWQRDMFSLYDQFIKEAMRFSFDSFVRFRLRKLKYRLVEVVEKAIDEYKLEHDYQVMINTCRDYLKNHSPRIHTIHLYLNQEINMVDQNGQKVPTQQIRRWLTHDLSFEDPLPISQRVIGPLVSIAPKKLVIYPNVNMHEGLLHTILSIFEERVELQKEQKAKLIPTFLN